MSFDVYMVLIQSLPHNSEVNFSSFPLFLHPPTHVFLLSLFSDTMLVSYLTTPLARPYPNNQIRLQGVGQTFLLILFL